MQYWLGRHLEKAAQAPSEYDKDPQPTVKSNGYHPLQAGAMPFQQLVTGLKIPTISSPHQLLIIRLANGHCFGSLQLASQKNPPRYRKNRLLQENVVG
jgi:hypothetical protein